jgi:hypothetical protein
MGSINNIDSLQRTWKKNKVLEAIKSLFKDKNQVTTVIMTDYDKSFIKNKIASKFTSYLNWKDFWTLQFLDKKWHDIVMEQENKTLHFKVNNRFVKDFNLNDIWVIKKLIETV